MKTVRLRQVLVVMGTASYKELVQEIQVPDPPVPGLVYRLGKNTYTVEDVIYVVAENVYVCRMEYKQHRREPHMEETFTRCLADGWMVP